MDENETYRPGPMYFCICARCHKSLGEMGERSIYKNVCSKCGTENLFYTKDGSETIQFSREKEEADREEREICCCCAGCGWYFGRLGRADNRFEVCPKCGTENIFYTNEYYVMTRYSRENRR